MAITILEQPDSYAPVYNDMVAMYSSNQTTQDKFKYCLDVAIDVEGLGATTLGRLKTPAITNFQTGVRVGYFNIKDLLVGSGFFTSQGIDNVLTDLSHRVILTPGEEYASSPTTAPVYYAATGQVYNMVAFNASLRVKEFIDYVATDKINTTTLSASSGIALYALTDRTEFVCTTTTVNELSFLCNGGSNIQAVVKSYNGGTLLATSTVACTTLNKTDFTINVSPSVIGPPSNTTHYTVQLERISNGNPLSPVYTYTFDTACSKFEKVNLYFLNRWGGFDNVIFDMKNIKSDNIQRGRFLKPDRYIYGYNAYEKSAQVYSSKIKTQHILNSNWVTQTELGWLAQLVESNKVLMSVGSDTTLIPIMIEDNNFVYKTMANDKLFQLQITASNGYEYERQTT